MNINRYYEEDLNLAKELLARNPLVTRYFFYKKCYPLFKSFFDRYYTDCTDCFEFIDEIYVLIMTPSRKTHRCQLENYLGESTLTSWLKTVCLYYCYKKYDSRDKSLKYSDSENLTAGDRFSYKAGTISIDDSSLNSDDVSVLLSMMPNQTYAELIYLRYVDCLENKEVAKVLKVDMDNYYNMHKRAKAQFVECYSREEKCHE